MTDHLPECPMEVHKGEDLWDDPLFGFPCWCYAIRAREQRVLDDAREAVAALDIGRDVRFSVDVQADALAAIDALRGDSNE